MVLGTVKLKHRKSTISLSTRGRDVAKELTARKNITKEFSIVFYETTYIVIRNSKLAGPSRNASKWTSWHRRITSTVHPEMNSRDIKKVVSHIQQIGQECTDASSIRLPSCGHSQKLSPPRIKRRTCRTHSFSTISKMAFVFFFQYLMVELRHVQKLVFFFF